MSQPHVGERRGALGAPAPVEQLNQMLTGLFLSRSILLAAELGVADALKDGPLPVAELAARTGSHPDALYRMLRALAAVGVFEQRPERCFANSELSTYLRSDVRGSLHAVARWLGDSAGWAAWGRLDHSVRTGAPAFEAALGCDFFSYMQSHPRTLDVFQAAMTSYSALTGGAVAQAYDFSSVGTLLDVGGGHGALLGFILERWPGPSAILYDRHEVIAQAEASVRAGPSASRIRLEAGDFFERVPEGADAIIMKHILHDWSDERCAVLLGNCRRSLPRGGRLLIVESVLTDEPESAFAKFLDLEMLVVTPGGRERTRDELAALLARSGFELARVLPTPSPVSVIEALAR
jgi:O-methyltransferase/methyltransferase family protein